MNDIEHSLDELPLDAPSEQLDARMDMLFRAHAARTKHFPAVMAWWQCLAASLICLVGGYCLHAVLAPPVEQEAGPGTIVYVLQGDWGANGSFIMDSPAPEMKEPRSGVEYTGGTT